eukprot:UN10304
MLNNMIVILHQILKHFYPQYYYILNVNQFVHQCIVLINQGVITLMFQQFNIMKLMIFLMKMMKKKMRMKRRMVNNKKIRNQKMIQKHQQRRMKIKI